MKHALARTLFIIGLFFAGSAANAQQPADSHEPSSNAQQSAPPAQPHAPTEQPAPPQPAAKATIYVYRPGSMVGAANHPAIFVNDEFMANLHNSEYASLEVPVGTVVLSYLPKSTVDLVPGVSLKNHLTKKAADLLRINAEPGKTYYFKWAYSGGSHLLKPVDETSGAKDIEKLHLAKD